MAEKPERPPEEDCCGSGCNPCIFDVYEKKLESWESVKNVILKASVLSDVKYLPFIITGIYVIDNDINLYTFQAIDKDLNPISEPIMIKMGDHLILKGVEKISRPYTPIVNDYLNKGCFQVIVKLYENGKMSEIMRKRSIKDVLYWRGPYNHLNNYLEILNKTQRLMLIGAGTGVVPLYNIAHALTSDDNIECFIKIFACFTSSKSILLRREFKSLQSFWNIDLVFHFSNSESNTLCYGEKGVLSKLSKDDIENEIQIHKEKSLFVIICGPEKFNNYFRDIVLLNGVDIKNVVVL